MNNIIRKQLENVKATTLDYDINSTKIIIPKTVKIFNAIMKVGGVYDIELFDSVVSGDIGEMLKANWNNGQAPHYKTYTVEVVASLSKMIKVNGVAIENNSDQFFGWLPNDGFTILKKYD